MVPSFFVDSAKVVAPHVGAWIEIRVLICVVRCANVAPHVGAWIEIRSTHRLGRGTLSHPTWVRGLKSLTQRQCTNTVRVAPHVGAWIEIIEIDKLKASLLSHPTWVRGLKSARASQAKFVQSSHPTWVRGLKLKYPMELLGVPRRTPRGCVD